MSIDSMDILCGAVLIGTLAVGVGLYFDQQDAATPPPMPTEPPALLIGVADDVDIHVFHDHENANTCYITTNRLRATAGGISCVPMAYRNLENDNVSYR